MSEKIKTIGEILSGSRSSPSEPLEIPCQPFTEQQRRYALYCSLQMYINGAPMGGLFLSQGERNLLDELKAEFDSPEESVEEREPYTIEISSTTQDIGQGSFKYQERLYTASINYQDKDGKGFFIATNGNSHAAAVGNLIFQYEEMLGFRCKAKE